MRSLNIFLLAYAIVIDVGPSSIRCLPHNHISKTKQYRRIIIMKHYQEVAIADCVAVVSPPVLSTVVNGVRRSEHVAHNRRPLC